MTTTAAPLGFRRYAPWVDRRGRFHPLRAVVLMLLLLPGAWLAGRWSLGGLGPRPLATAIHNTGYAAVWTLLASLAVTPAKALLSQPNVVVVRRMVGVAALAYAVAHLVLYCTDQNWRLLAIVSEVALRFYLTIGFVALLGLLVLGATSTDGWIRSMGRNWKRLHRMVYPLAALAMAHYVLQTKLDVSQAMLSIGVFAWFMLWRALPAGKDREWPVLTGLSVVAAAATVAAEYSWYHFGTRANAWKIVTGEFDITFGLHPAGQVLAVGLLATGIVELVRIGATPHGQRPFYTIGIYALGAFAGDVAAFVLGWPVDDGMGVLPVVMDLLWGGLLALLGAARWKFRNSWHKHVLDALWLTSLLDQVIGFGIGRHLGGLVIASIVACATVLALRIVAGVSRRRADVGAAGSTLADPTSQGRVANRRKTFPVIRDTSLS